VCFQRLSASFFRSRYQRTGRNVSANLQQNIDPPQSTPRKSGHTTDARPARVNKLVLHRVVAAGPVSRILSTGFLRQDGHSSGPHIAARLKRPTRRFDAPSRHVLGRSRGPSLFGLAPCGVCPARCITAAAVRSYRTFSPLPRCRGGMFSVALSVG
jgi:hypothetical protein